MNPRLISFIGGTTGAWRVVSTTTLAGAPIATVERLNLVAGSVASVPPGAAWVLRGVTSNERYVTRSEKEQLVAQQADLGRAEATRAAIIPLRKSEDWWRLTQDERRAIFEERSRHIAIGVRYLPAVARRLHHCRDVSEQEPFDFVTWFEFAPGDEAVFDTLLTELRASEEWRYVDREIDIRLTRD